MESAAAAAAAAEEEDSSQTSEVGAFPTPDVELANLEPGFLEKRCGLDYRTKSIMKLSQGICSGALELEKLEGPSAVQGEAPRASILGIYGFGLFCGANMMMLLGAMMWFLRTLKQFGTSRRWENVGRTI